MPKFIIHYTLQAIIFGVATLVLGSTKARARIKGILSQEKGQTLKWFKKSEKTLSYGVEVCGNEKNTISKLFNYTFSLKIGTQRNLKFLEWMLIKTSPKGVIFGLLKISC
jgi:hypothetical protein